MRVGESETVGLLHSIKGPIEISCHEFKVKLEHGCVFPLQCRSIGADRDKVKE